MRCVTVIYYIKILSNVFLSRLNAYVGEIFGIISAHFDITNQLLIIYSAFVKYLRKWEYYGASISAICRITESLYDSVRRQV